MLNKGTERFVRIAAIILGIILVAIIVSVLTVSIKYYLLTKNPQPAVIEGKGVFLPDAKPVLGEKRIYRVCIKAPWNMNPGQVDITPPNGLQLVTEPAYSRERYGWGVTYWLLQIDFQPFWTGELKDGKVMFSFMIPGQEAQDFSLPLPTLQVQERENAKAMDKIEIAQMVPVPKRLHWAWYTLAAVILVLLLIGFWLLYRSMQEKKVRIVQKPIWETALEAIAELKNSLQKRSIIPEEAVADLTDIVRHFLESYLGIRAERQTTGEFLRELERGEALPEQDRKFLRSFLETSDMIKFARADASDEVFEKTAMRAETLVESCRDAAIAAEKEKKKKGGKVS